MIVRGFSALRTLHSGLSTPDPALTTILRRRHLMPQDQNIEELVSQITEVILSRLGVSATNECRLHHDECFVKCPDRMRSLIDEGGVRFGLTGAESEAAREVARYIDHTLLKPNATRDDIMKICEEGVRYGFASVCINPTR